MKMENLLTIEEAAALFQVHHNTIRKLIRTQGLPCFKLNGSVYRFRESELLAWVDAQREAQDAKR
jgi:excisionase family DNA binding protein